MVQTNPSCKISTKGKILGKSSLKVTQSTHKKDKRLAKKNVHKDKCVDDYV